MLCRSSRPRWTDICRSSGTPSRSGSASASARSSCGRRAKSNRPRLPDSRLYLRHLGIYAYRVGFLHDYVAWPPAEIEQLESLEQLRALYHGVKIHVDVAAVALPPGVDTQEDLERVRALLAG